MKGGKLVPNCAGSNEGSKYDKKGYDKESYKGMVR